MISVQDYRTAVDCFLGKTQFSSFISQKQEMLDKARRKQNNSKFKSTRGGIGKGPSLGCVSGGKQ